MCKRSPCRPRHAFAHPGSTSPKVVPAPSNSRSPWWRAPALSLAYRPKSNSGSASDHSTGAGDQELSPIPAHMRSLLGSKACTAYRPRRHWLDPGTADILRRTAGSEHTQPVNFGAATGRRRVKLALETAIATRRHSEHESSFPTVCLQSVPLSQALGYHTNPTARTMVRRTVICVKLWDRRRALLPPPIVARRHFRDGVRQDEHGRPGEPKWKTSWNTSS